MKKLLIKIPAMLAMLLTILSFVCLVQSFTEGNDEIWILAVIVAMPSLVFYAVDAIISLVKGIKNTDRVFNIILAIVLLVGIPMFLLVGNGGPDSFLVIWNAYYLAMFVLEIVSMVRLVKAAQ